MRLRPSQSRAGSLAEASTNVLVGYMLALATQRLVYPLFGITKVIGCPSRHPSAGRREAPRSSGRPGSDRK